MTEKKLHYFITVAECENISQAATTLFIAQPALSKIINGMEQEIGYPLFDRVGKRIFLNENGRIFYEYAKKITGNYENLRASLSEMNQKKVNSLCVGVSVSSQLLSALMEQFRKSRLGENEQIQIRASYPLDFNRDHIDILLDADAEKKEEPGKEYLLREKILLAFPKGHPLEKKKKIGLQDTLQYPYVLPDENTRLGKMIADYMQKHELHHPENTTFTNNSYVQCEFVSRGLGISFIPEKSWVYAHTLGNIVLRPIEGEVLWRNIFFQYHPGKYRNELMERFGEFLKLYYRQMNS